MKEFAGKLAVITGGGTGMGRELARQLVAEGCDVAMCDVSAENMAESARLCTAEAPQGIRVSTHLCDVADEQAVLAFRDEVEAQHGRGYVNLLFNNAGVGGGASMTSEEERDIWERTFNICWFGVYYNVRAFMPLLLAADEAHIVNTSSVNGFWASLGPGSTHSAYSAAKFAVKGFTEALINDFEANAPHIKVSVVMPGHIGTSIVTNTSLLLRDREPGDLSDAEVERMRARLNRLGIDASALDAEQVREIARQQAISFRDNARTSAAEAARIILDGVRHERWRILVGPDAEALDRAVRETPEEAYTGEFLERLRASGEWGTI